MHMRSSRPRLAVRPLLWISFLAISVGSLVTLAEAQRRVELAGQPKSEGGFVTLRSGEVVETAAFDYDERNLSGVYLPFTPSGYEAFGRTIPPMTTEGRAKLAERVSPDQVADAKINNDPQFACDPQGFPRLWFDQELIENIHLEGRLLQLSQWDATLREIWMDGRALPTREDLAVLGQAYYGYSVGEWQRDTLVVQTVGLDERNWIDDDFGYPLSAEARIEERYQRVGPDVLAVQYTLYDPKYYASPWVGEVKQWRRAPRALLTHAGWFGLFSGATEAICAPVNEQAFKKVEAPAYETKTPER
jgi:hypothetical protein